MSGAVRDLDQLLRHPAAGAADRGRHPRGPGDARRPHAGRRGAEGDPRGRPRVHPRRDRGAARARPGSTRRPRSAEQLWERTEGWAAGLRLAALALRGHADPAAFVAEFAGDDSTVADYLLGEVLAQQPEDLREFLLRISVVDLVDGELADALDAGGPTPSGCWPSSSATTRCSSSTGGAARVAPAAPAVRRAAALRAALSGPDEVPALHSRAAKWFHEHDRPIDALRHAAAGRDWAHVGALAGAHWVRLLLEGELEPLRKVLDRCRRAARARRPGDRARARRRARGRRRRRAGDPLVQRRPRRPRRGRRRAPAGLRPRVATVGLLRGRLRGDNDEAIGYARAMLEPDGARRRGWAPTACGRCALASSASPSVARRQRARRRRPRARREARRRPPAGTGCSCRRWRTSRCRRWSTAATSARPCGSPRRRRLASAARLVPDVARRARGRPLSGIAFHQERLDGARAPQRRAVERLSHSGDRPLRGLDAMQRGRIDAAYGRHEAALGGDPEAREWLHDWPIIPAIPALIAAIEATVTAALGEREAAIALLEREPASPRPRSPREPGPARRGAGARPHGRRAALGLRRPDGPAHGRRGVGDRGARRRRPRRPPGGLRRARAARSTTPSRRVCGGAFLMHGASIGPLLRRQRRTGTGHRALLDDLSRRSSSRTGRRRRLLAEPLSSARRPCCGSCRR